MTYFTIPTHPVFAATAPCVAVKSNDGITHNFGETSGAPAFFFKPEARLSRVETFVLRDKKAKARDKKAHPNTRWVESVADALACEREYPHSFAFLKSEGMRIVRLFDENGKLIEGTAANNYRPAFQRIGLEIKSDNPLKLGKRIGRLARPTPHYAWVRDLTVRLDRATPAYWAKMLARKAKVSYRKAHRVVEKTFDGMLVIGPDVLEACGINPTVTPAYSCYEWTSQDALHGKGNAVYHPGVVGVVAFEGGLKDDLALAGNEAYIALNPQKAMVSARLDSQTLMNNLDVLGAENVVGWMQDMAIKAQERLVTGEVDKWFEDAFFKASKDKLDPSYQVQRFALHGVKAYDPELGVGFPGLIRQQWRMLRTQLKRASERFRVEIPGAGARYARVDVRDIIDVDGAPVFAPLVDVDVAEADERGNLWFHPFTGSTVLGVLGGGDMDDRVVIVPLEGGDALFYRSPNMRGEAVRMKLSGFPVTVEHALETTIPKLHRAEEPSEAPAKRRPSFRWIYSLNSLVVAQRGLDNSELSIGVASIAEEMVADIAYTDKAQAAHIRAEYPWNLEVVVDEAGAGKGGPEAARQMSNVREAMLYVLRNGIPVSMCTAARAAGIVKGLAKRTGEDLEFTVHPDHPVDRLRKALEDEAQAANREVLGYWDPELKARVPGIADELQGPAALLRPSRIGATMEKAKALRVEFVKRGMKVVKGEAQWDQAQSWLRAKLAAMPFEKAVDLVHMWAYDIYSSEHLKDNILFIWDEVVRDPATGEETVVPGVDRYFLEVLIRCGIAQRVETFQETVDKFKAAGRPATMGWKSNRNGVTRRTDVKAFIDGRVRVWAPKAEVEAMFPETGRLAVQRFLSAKTIEFWTEDTDRFAAVTLSDDREVTLRVDGSCELPDAKFNLAGAESYFTKDGTASATSLYLTVK